jgi:hypothetical protein
LPRFSGNGTPAPVAEPDPFVEAPLGTPDLFELRIVLEDGTITTIGRSTDVGRVKRAYATYNRTTNVTLELYDHTLGLVRASRRL